MFQPPGRHKAIYGGSTYIVQITWRVNTTYFPVRPGTCRSLERLETIRQGVAMRTQEATRRLHLRAGCCCGRHIGMGCSWGPKATGILEGHVSIGPWCPWFEWANRSRPPRRSLRRSPDCGFLRQRREMPGSDRRAEHRLALPAGSYRVDINHAGSTAPPGYRPRSRSWQDRPPAWTWISTRNPLARQAGPNFRKLSRYNPPVPRIWRGPNTS
jgi:hypothetical protein